jgi:thiazole synthase
MADAIAASGTQMVTVALRRVDIENENDDMLAAIDPTKYQLLPNTSGARDAEEAIRLSRLARAASGIEWVKLEVTPDPYYLLPDGEETLKATLVKDGFIVLPYINADPILAKKLQDAGCATVMPLASPIGSNQGMKTKASIEIIIEQATVPVVVDAGLGPCWSIPPLRRLSILWKWPGLSKWQPKQGGSPIKQGLPPEAKRPVPPVR